MYGRAGFVITMALASSGCAVLFPPIEPGQAPAAAPGSFAALPANTTVKEIDVTEIPRRERCENLTRGGSRIVVAQRCRSRGDDGVDEFALAEKLDRVREDQEELDRRRRELETRRGPGLY